MSLPSYSQLQNYKETSYDLPHNAYVNWSGTSEGNCQLEALFSDDNIQSISHAITRALEGVDPKNRHIIVSKEQIVSVLSKVYQDGTRPNIGDIHSRFIVPQSQCRNDMRSIINQTINIIVRTIRDETEVIENNKKLSVWSTVYGNFNKEGLRAHAPIKIRRRHPQYMAFHLKY